MLTFRIVLRKCSIFPLFLLSFLFVTLIHPFGSDSALGQTWANTYGGMYTRDKANSLERKTDGGYVVGGFTESFGFGFWILNLDSNGDIIWQKTYANGYVASSIHETPDGGYVVAGTNVIPGSLNSNVLVLKLDEAGNVEWQKTLGGQTWGVGFPKIQANSDGGYVLATEFWDYGQGQNSPSNPYGAWVVKLDSNGNLELQKVAMGRDPYREISLPQRTIDGGYVVAGVQYLRGWVSKLDMNADAEWEKEITCPTDAVDHLSIQQTTDGGYILTGLTWNYRGFVLKLDSDGNLQWQRGYGDLNQSIALYSGQQTADGGFIVAGSIRSSSPDSIGTLLMKLDLNGSIEWAKVLGGVNIPNVQAQQAGDGGFILAGTSLFGYGISQGGYDEEIAVLKLNGDGNLPGCPFVRDSSIPEENLNISLNSIDLGWSTSDFSPAAETVINVADTNATAYPSCGGSFKDVSKDHWASQGIMTIANAGITSGCSSIPPYFCPDSSIPRMEIAVFIEQSLGVAGVPACTGNRFWDVSVGSPLISPAFCGFIEDFATKGITGGCQSDDPATADFNEAGYCPFSPVTRGQMAVFIESAIGATPATECTGMVFNDVNTNTVGDLFCRYIEDFASKGITFGCQADDPLTTDVNEAMYCPDAPVTRAEMAVFLVVAPAPLNP